MKWGTTESIRNSRGSYLAQCTLNWRCGLKRKTQRVCCSVCPAVCADTTTKQPTGAQPESPAPQFLRSHPTSPSPPETRAPSYSALALKKTHSHSHCTHWQPLIFLCLTYRKSNVFRLLLIPGLQSSPGPGTHTQSPVWGSQEWLGGHEQVWAQLVPNVPVWHTAKTDIWQMFDELVEWQTYWAWSRNKKLFSAENYSMTYLFRNHIQEIWQTVFSKRNNC